MVWSRELGEYVFDSNDVEVRNSTLYSIEEIENAEVSCFHQYYDDKLNKEVLIINVDNIGDNFKLIKLDGECTYILTDGKHNIMIKRLSYKECVDKNLNMGVRNMKLIFTNTSTDCVNHYDVETNSITVSDLLNECVEFCNKYKNLQFFEIYFQEPNHRCLSKSYNLDYKFSKEQLSCKIEKVRLDDGYGQISLFVYVSYKDK